MIVSNRRIFLAIFLSLLLFFGIKYLYSHPQIFSPDNIYASIAQKTAEIKTKISSIKLPNPSNFIRFTNFKNFLTLDLSLPSDNITIKQHNNNNNSFFSPQITQPTSTNFNNVPTGTWQPTPTLPRQSPTIGGAAAGPTSVKVPTPTKYVKPTKSPTPIPFKLTNPRPGKNIREVAELVGKIMCLPPAMVYAIYDNEAGYLGPKVTANWTYYNTYPGSDPTDVPGSTEVFGVTQMMGDTWHKIKPYVAQKLGTSAISLNVTFDSMAAAGFHIQNVSLAGTDHVSCDDWPVKYILYGACRYNGACPANTMGQTQYYNPYTYSVCASYNEYGAKQKNCR